MIQDKRQPCPSTVLSFEQHLRVAFSAPCTRATLETIYQDIIEFWQSEQDRKAVYLRKGIWDFILDEFLPALTWIEAIFPENVEQFYFPRDNGPIDLRVTKAKRTIANVQIVTICDGQKRRLQFELLATVGHATASGEIVRDPKTRLPVQRRAARRKDKQLELLAEEIAAAIGAKSTKSYPSQTTLLCCFTEPDWFAPRWQPADYEGLAEAAAQACQEGSFAAVYLCGTREWKFVQRIT